MPLTHLATATIMVWKLLIDHGHDPEILFREKGIDPDLMKRPEARVNYKKFVSLWEKTAEKIKDPCVGLRSAEYWHPSYLNALGYAWLASRTLREALERLVSYLRIVTEGTEIYIRESPEGLIVELAFKLGPVQPSVVVDSQIAILMAMCRANYGRNLKPVIVHIVHEAPPCSEKYEAYFDSKVVFNSNMNSITFSIEDVEQPLSSSNPYLAEVNDQIIIKYMAKLEVEDITNRVQVKIIDNLPSGKVTDEKISSMLYMSVRTLQRRLQKEGTTFHTVLNETRNDLAKQYIKDPSIRLEEIAFLLGFSEYSVFSKAFKRWTGHSPKKLQTLR
jgi:AraC-like DNA-binding protein